MFFFFYQIKNFATKEYIEYNFYLLLLLFPPPEQLLYKADTFISIFFLINNKPVYAVQEIFKLLMLIRKHQIFINRHNIRVRSSLSHLTMTPFIYSRPDLLFPLFSISLWIYMCTTIPLPPFSVWQSQAWWHAAAPWDATVYVMLGKEEYLGWILK